MGIARQLSTVAFLLVVGCSSDQPHYAAPPISEPFAGCTVYVFFAENSTELSPLSLEKLNDLSRWCTMAPGKRLFVVGHADETGSAQYNLELSRRRAEAVRSYLLFTGFLAKTIEVIARGDTQPIVTTKGRVTSEGRDPQNRFVVTEIDFKS